MDLKEQNKSGEYIKGVNDGFAFAIKMVRDHMKGIERMPEDLQKLQEMWIKGIPK